MEKYIEIKDLYKKYGKLSAVEGISFDVYKGEVFGLLGENGAGKSTTLEMIEGLRRPSSGEIKVFGKNIKSNIRLIKQRIGVQLQSSAYYSDLTLKEILNLFCSFYDNCANTQELLKVVDLEDKADKTLSQISGGQKQRFSIIASLVNEPELVFLDEPTTGLDPLARRNLWEIILEIKKRGKTIVLTTHYMEEAEVLCDRVAIMDKGKILVIGDTDRVVEKVDYPFKIKLATKGLSQEDKRGLSKFGDLDPGERENNYVLKLQNKDGLMDALREVEKINPETFTVEKASLEDLFIQLTGREIEKDEDAS
jgi:ABC-2 type transport system ATP-binding protein